MLKIDSLTEKIKTVMKTRKPAYEAAFKSMFDQKGDRINEMAETFAEQIMSCDDSMAEMLAAAIDYYIRSANIHGTIITQGSPVTQMAAINGMPVNQLNGSIPNTLGIS